MLERLTEEEIRGFNEWLQKEDLHKIDNRYFFDTNIYPSRVSLEKLATHLKEDFGDDFAARATSSLAFQRIGIRALYEGVYQMTLEDPSSRPKLLAMYPEGRSGVKVVRVGKRKVVFKGYQGGLAEKKIAKCAGDLGIGPRQYGPGFFELAEDFLDDEGPLFWNPFSIGKKIGTLMQRMHRADIIYGDYIPRHLRFSKGEFRLIDWGIARIYDGTLASFIGTPEDSYYKFYDPYAAMTFDSRLLTDDETEFLIHSKRDNKIEKTTAFVPKEELKKRELALVPKDFREWKEPAFGRLLTMGFSRMMTFSRKRSVAKLLEGLEFGYLDKTQEIRPVIRN